MGSKGPCVILGVGRREGEAPAEPLGELLCGSAGASPSRNRARLFGPLSCEKTSGFCETPESGRRLPSARPPRHPARCPALIVAFAGLAIMFAGAAEPLAQPAGPLAEETPAERLERLDRMSPVEKEALRQKQERFDELPLAEKERLRSLHTELTCHQEGHHLAQIAARYSQWLRTLSPGQRAELLALPPEQRLNRIQTFKEEQQSERIRELVRTQLKPDDIREISAWLGRYADAHEAELLALLGSEGQEQLRRVPSGIPRQVALFRALQRRPAGKPLPVPAAAELDDLRGRLSGEARQVFDSVSEEDKKLALVLQWVRLAMMTHFMPPPVSSQELERFFAEDLDREQREFLEQKPHEQFQQELRRLYWMHKARGREGDPRPPYFRRGNGWPTPYRDGEGPPHGNGSRGPHRGHPDFRPETPAIRAIRMTRDARPEQATAAARNFGRWKPAQPTTGRPCLAEVPFRQGLARPCPAYVMIRAKYLERHDHVQAEDERILPADQVALVPIFPPDFRSQDDVGVRFDVQPHRGGHDLVRLLVEVLDSRPHAQAVVDAVQEILIDPPRLVEAERVGSEMVEFVVDVVRLEHVIEFLRDLPVEDNAVRVGVLVAARKIEPPDAGVKAEIAQGGGVGEGQVVGQLEAEAAQEGVAAVPVEAGVPTRGPAAPERDVFAQGILAQDARVGERFGQIHGEGVRVEEVVGSHDRLRTRRSCKSAPP